MAPGLGQAPCALSCVHLLPTPCTAQQCPGSLPHPTSCHSPTQTMDLKWGSNHRAPAQGRQCTADPERGSGGLPGAGVGGDWLGGEGVEAEAQREPWLALEEQE